MFRLMMTRWLAVPAIAVCLSVAATAAVQDPGLTGSTQYDGWQNLTAFDLPGYPGFPGTSPWPMPIGSNTAGSADADLARLAGNIYPATQGLYDYGTSFIPFTQGSTLEVADTTPVADLATVVFQIVITESTGFDFFTAPTLDHSAGGTDLPADTMVQVERIDVGDFVVPGTGETEDVFQNTYLLQWDLTGVVDPITEFSINWTSVQHSRVAELRLDQSDTFTAIPEPTALSMITVAGLAWVARRRRV